ncbi:MAG: ribosome small subunit-dependent GTPase A [Candidatus Algichlamydia australiensis]|nr:ribosome small subunit-dependent GTPase A [Chlamydiales bacterium]
MSNDYLDFEEQFHREGKKRKEREERKRISKKDRSKFKKTDQKKDIEAPTDPNLLRGRVLSIHGEIIKVTTKEKIFECCLKGTLKKEKKLLRNLVAVGDFVRFYPKENELSPIVHVDPRHSYLSRREHFKGKKEQLLAVNIDQVLIVVSVGIPPLKPALIDRYIIAAKKGNMAPLIIVNKSDLLTPKERPLLTQVQEIYKALHIPLLMTSVETGEGIETLKEAMREKTSLFSGQSGVGKSSLINKALGLEITVGDVIEKTKKGAHTTTSTTLIPIENGGFCVDSPGIKSFGMWELTAQEIESYFTEINERKIACKYPNCTHRHEPGCAVKEALEKGEISPLRYESYLALLDEIEGYEKEKY